MAPRGTPWIPGAIIVPCSLDGGSMLGDPETGEAYATWHTYESKGYGLSAAEGARRLVAAGHGCTGTFHPVTGQIGQMVPGTRASRTLRNESGGVQTNRAGRFHAQFEVIGDAERPWTDALTDAGREGLGRIMAWLRSWGVPDVWPAGDPPAYPGGSQNRIAPAASGHYGHSQWRENTHGDPGRISVAAMFGVQPHPGTPGTYTVVRGDTLSGIGLRLAVAWERIASENGIRAPWTIYPGQVLRIPTGSVPSTPADPTWQRGSHGQAVYRLQAGLLRVFPAYARPIKQNGGPNGVFGPATEGVVKEFQRRAGLTQDGVVGSRTRSELVKYGVTF